MIPTMLLAGAAIGRWWAVPLGGLAWALTVVLAASVAPGALPLAAALGAANAAAGVLVRRSVAPAARRLRGSGPLAKR